MSLRIKLNVLSASGLLIQDAGIAMEMTEVVRNQIVEQSEVAVLAQSNFLSQGVLQMLG